MKVLIAAARIDRSETCFFQALKAQGVDVEIMYDTTDPSYASFHAAGIPVTHRVFKSRVDLGALRELRTLLKSRNFDIIHSYTNRTLSHVLLASRGLPAKHVTYRGTIGHLHRWDPASWLTHLNPRVDKIICVSEAVRRHLLSLRIPESKLVTIYKGHDPAWYRDLPHVPLSELGIPDGAFLVGFAGCMRPLKGVDILLNAALRLAGELPVHFLLVGTVQDRRIFKLAEDLRIRDRVHLTGFRKDAAALAGACQVFVMPSLRREGLPRAVIEAMSQGVTPIVSDVGGMPELVADRKCGLVVPPGDPAALALAIRHLMEHPEERRKMGEQAQERIRTVFHVEQTIRQTLDLYHQLLAEK